MSRLLQSHVSEIYAAVAEPDALSRIVAVLCESLALDSIALWWSDRGRILDLTTSDAGAESMPPCDMSVVRSADAIFRIDSTEVTRGAGEAGIIAWNQEGASVGVVLQAWQIAGDPRLITRGPTECSFVVIYNGRCALLNLTYPQSIVEIILYPCSLNFLRNYDKIILHDITKMAILRGHDTVQYVGPINGEIVALRCLSEFQFICVIERDSRETIEKIIEIKQ